MSADTHPGTIRQRTAVTLCEGRITQLYSSLSPRSLTDADGNEDDVTLPYRSVLIAGAASTIQITSPSQTIPLTITILHYCSSRSIFGAQSVTTIFFSSFWCLIQTVRRSEVLICGAKIRSQGQCRCQTSLPGKQNKTCSLVTNNCGTVASAVLRIVLMESPN